jgi:hypothetical protein
VRVETLLRSGASWDGQPYDSYLSGQPELSISRSVAMESTSVYWIPVYQILEARGLEVRLPGTYPNVFCCPLLVQISGAQFSWPRTPACHAGGRGFKSRRSGQISQEL